MPFEPDALRAQLQAPIQGGRHGRRADGALPGQLSLFDADGAPVAAAPILPSPPPMQQVSHVMADVARDAAPSLAISSHRCSPGPRDELLEAWMEYTDGDAKEEPEEVVIEESVDEIKKETNYVPENDFPIPPFLKNGGNMNLDL